MSNDGASSRQPRGQESRKAFLDAGLEVLRRQTLADVMGPLSSRLIAAAAHRTTGSFYHYWKSTDDYLRDLLLHVFEPGSFPYLEEVRALLDRLAREEVDQVTFLRELCCYDLAETAADPKFAVEMVLWSKSDDERVRSCLHRFYAHADDTTTSRFQALTDKWQRELRPPFDQESASVVMTAVLEGLAVRRLIEPDRVPDRLLGDVVLALIPGMSRSIGDPQELDDWVAWLNEADGSVAIADEVDGDSESVRERILTSAAALYRTRGHDAPTTGDIARAAGVSAATVRQHFPTTPVLVERLLSVQLAEIQRSEAQADPREPRSVLDALLRRLAALARVVIAERAIGRAFVETSLEKAQPRAPGEHHVTRPSDLLQPLLDLGQQIGLVRSEPSAADLAEMMSTLVLLRALSHPTQTAESLAATVAFTTLEGALVRSDAT